MNEKIKDKKELSLMVVLFTVAYMVSYMTRINYAAVISEMERETGIARSLLSMAVTGSFITYGAGQIISGVLGDLVSPKKLVSIGFITTILMNTAIPFCNSPYLKMVVWCVNGFAQSFMWPPMVKIMSVRLTTADYESTSTKMAFGASFGTIAVYLLSPALISLWGWKSVFFFAAICAVIILLFWHKYCVDVTVSKPQKQEEKEVYEKGGIKALFTPTMICILIAIALHGMLRDGVITWMPTYISETYNLGSAVSILTGVVLPIFSITCIQIATKIHQKKVDNILTCSGVLFAVATLAAVLLSLLSGVAAIFSVLCSAVLTGCMHGVNVMLVCFVPNCFRKYGKVSTASGVINASTYIGSAAFTYGIALLSEKFGWGLTLKIWILIAAMGTLFSFLASKRWMTQYQNR
ncbi:MAG: MFS transporter [Clostridia bacterium]|nr:MFS transporter [Clostridia bacterium]